MDLILKYLPYLGWGAMALSLLSSFSRTMIPLRSFAASSNIVSIIAAAAAGYWPNALQNAIQLPMNVFRLRQMRKLIADMKPGDEGEVDANWLMPFAHVSEHRKGAVIFRKGDAADRLYYIATGTVSFPEIGVEIQQGSLFGEFAFFTKEGERTQTAVCAEDCALLSIGEYELKQLYYQNPEFGWYLIRLIVQRLQDNVERNAKRARSPF
ncbi:Crp/Fnr family transcriptional regulator [Flaviflagellibacter deserti]|uniref:Crp/Fnr family transcriptional regulator n=1 Tax=Flaviflagellibacter deserti TaxID=2267266 RepID=A0ABV9YYW4_9HYPH